MMNHFFALLILLGMIFGVYKATSSAATLSERQVRLERWEEARDEAMQKRQELLESQGDLVSLEALPRVDTREKVIVMPDGQRITPESFEITAGQMLKARWNEVKKIGKGLTLTAVDAPALAVSLVIEYIGLMALWLGVMRVAEKAGLVQVLARGLSPIMRRLFPDVPRDHPAMSGMLMNIAANMLGLDNAATPLGLAAMKDLQKLNPRKDTATNAMVMFLAINTSSVVILPFAVLGFRAAAGSENPQAFLAPMLLATTCSTLAAVLVTPLFARFYPRSDEPEAGNGSNGDPDPSADTSGQGHTETESMEPTRPGSSPTGPLRSGAITLTPQ